MLAASVFCPYLIILDYNISSVQLEKFEHNSSLNNISSATYALVFYLKITVVHFFRRFFFFKWKRSSINR